MGTTPPISDRGIGRARSGAVDALSDPGAAAVVEERRRPRGFLGLGFNAAEDRLLRRALLWVIGLSALAAPRTFEAAPVEVPAAVVMTYTAWQALVWLALLRRLLDAQKAAVLAAVAAATAGMLSYLRTFQGVIDGTVTADAAGILMLTTLMAICGITFVALPVRVAAAASLSYLVAYPVAMLAKGGDGARDLIMTRGITGGLRYGLVAIVLFWIVAALSAKRVEQRELAASAERRAHRRLRSLQEEQVLRASLFAEAAHELKGPLAVVQASAETLQHRRGQMTPEQLETLLDALVRNVDRLQGRAQEVLSGARRPLPDPSESGPPVVDVAEALDRALAETQGLLDGWRVEVDAPTGLLVAIDEDDLEHVIENFLSNAAKYSPAGTTVSIRAVADDDHVAVTVTDQGGGLDVDQATRVFQAYYRTEGAIERAPGDGVGLAVVERLVGDWGGQVWCEPDTNSTTFGFTIPRVAS